MSDELENFSEGLVRETLSEAAQTFFGTRRDLEHEIELFHEATRRLAGVERAMLRRAAALHHLLLEGEAEPAFYAAIGVPAGHLPDLAGPDEGGPDEGEADEGEADAGEPDGGEPGRIEPDKSGLARPFALTGAGRYGKLLLAAYAALHQAADEYVHGRHYTDPRGSGRKLLTIHFLQLRDWCERLNQRIAEVNAANPPSATLRFVQGLDPSSLDKARVTGGSTFGPCCRLDQDLAFPRVECVTMRFAAAPDLPPPAAARKAVLAFAADLYRAHRERLERLLAAW